MKINLYKLHLTKIIARIVTSPLVNDESNFLAPTPVSATSRLFAGLVPNNPNRIKVKDNIAYVSK